MIGASGVQCGGEHILQGEKGLPTIVEEVPGNSFMGEVDERNHNV